MAPLSCPQQSNRHFNSIKDQIDTFTFTWHRCVSQTHEFTRPNHLMHVLQLRLACHTDRLMNDTCIFLKKITSNLRKTQKKKKKKTLPLPPSRPISPLPFFPEPPPPKNPISRMCSLLAPFPSTVLFYLQHAQSGVMNKYFSM